jgi:hypothetical protein
MALLIECMLTCAPILIDNADIVREAMFQQLAVNGCMVTHRRHPYGYQREAWGIILPLGLDRRAEAVLEGDQR